MYYSLLKWGNYFPNLVNCYVFTYNTKNIIEINKLCYENNIRVKSKLIVNVMN